MSEVKEPTEQPTEQPAERPTERPTGRPQRSGPPFPRRRHTGDEAEKSDARMRRRLNKTDRKAHEQVRGFVSMFQGAGLSEERLRRAHTVPAARKILHLGKNIDDTLRKTDQKANAAFKEKLSVLIEKAQRKPREVKQEDGTVVEEEPKDVVVPPSVMVALMTLSVAFQAFKGMVTNVFEGMVEAVMKVSSAFSDSLQENYRRSFTPQNDYQEIAVALVLFIGIIFSGLSTLIGTASTIVKTTVSQVLLQLYGKDVSTLAINVFDIITVWITMHIVFALSTPKAVLLILLLLVILSFFLKMDDLPEDEEDKEETEEKKEGEEEQKPVEQVIADAPKPAEEAVSSTPEEPKEEEKKEEAPEEPKEEPKEEEKPKEE